MPGLVFKNVNHYWQGNDYKDSPAKAGKDGKPDTPAVRRHVSMTSVAVGTDRPLALIFMTHMNADFDGAPTCYGPYDKATLDYLDNAGRQTHYYGLMSVLPTAKNPPGADGMITTPEGYRVKVAKDYPDSKGYLPVVQQTGTTAGYFVSTTSRPNPQSKGSIYEQSYYLDSSAVAFGALSDGLHNEGVNGGDLGMAIRLDTFATTAFNFLKGEGSHNYAVGECSYKAYLDIGGTPKRRDEPYLRNNFPTCFIVFPGSTTSPLMRTAWAENSYDLAAFIAIQGQVDASSRGASGLAKFNQWVAGGRRDRPPNCGSIVNALHKFGYAPDVFEAVRPYARAAANVVETMQNL